MAIVETYKSGDYDRMALKGVKRYVRRNWINGSYRWIEQSVSHPRYDIRSGTCERSDLPDDIAKAADSNRSFPSYVDWSL
jgi:hypothetical protein